MNYATVNKDYSLRIDYTDGLNDLVSPFEVFITITGNGSNTPIGIYDELSIDVAENDTYTVLLIPSTVNQKSLDLEFRFVDVKLVDQEGKIYHKRYSYILREDIKLPIDASDVLALIGISEPEYHKYVDLYRAYDEVSNELSSSLTVSDLVTSGSSSVTYIIEAVKLKAAINTSIGFQTFILQSEQADNTVYKRFSSVNFSDIDRKLEANYNKAIANVLGTAGTPEISLFLAVTGTDPVTGE